MMRLIGTDQVGNPVYEHGGRHYRRNPVGRMGRGRSTRIRDVDAMSEGMVDRAHESYWDQAWGDLDAVLTFLSGGRGGTVYASHLRFRHDGHTWNAWHEEWVPATADAPGRYYVDGRYVVAKESQLDVGAEELVNELEGRHILESHNQAALIIRTYIEMKHEEYVDSYLSEPEDADSDDWRDNPSQPIRSDDPNAVAALKAKLEELERRRDEMKRRQAAWKKAGKPSVSDTSGHGSASGMNPVWIKLKADLGLSDRDFIRMLERASLEERWLNRGPYPPYEFTNIGATIRKTRERLEYLAGPDVYYGVGGST